MIEVIRQILVKFACMHQWKKWTRAIPVHVDGSEKPDHFDQTVVCGICGKFKRLKL